MLVRIYDLEPARAGGVIHIRSRQTEKAGGGLKDSQRLAGSSPYTGQKPPAPAKGGTPGPELWGLGDSRKGLLGSSHSRASHTWRSRASEQPPPPFSFHLGAEKKEEKVRKRQLSTSRSGRTETAEGVQMWIFS